MYCTTMHRSERVVIYVVSSRKAACGSQQNRWTDWQGQVSNGECSVKCWKALVWWCQEPLANLHKVAVLSPSPPKSGNKLCPSFRYSVASYLIG